jgi:hypothetical protein
MSLSKILPPLLGALLLVPAWGQLPSLNEKPWLGHFAGYERRDFQIGVTAAGQIELQIKKDNGGVLGVGRVIYIRPEICEMSNGRLVVKQPVIESLSSPDQPTVQPKKTTFRGKVTGNAEFEITLEFDDDEIHVGGRLLNKGELTNPVHFQIRVRYGDVYRYTSAEKLENESSRDRIETLDLDKKKGKIKFFDSIDLASEKINGKGLSAVEIEMKGLNNVKFQYEAQGASAMRLENNDGLASAPLNGFSVIWRADETKDTDHKARLYLQLK